MLQPSKYCLTTFLNFYGGYKNEVAVQRPAKQANHQPSGFEGADQTDIPYLRYEFLPPLKLTKKKQERFRPNTPTTAPRLPNCAVTTSEKIIDNSEVRTLTTEILVLMAKNYAIIEQIHGHETVGTPPRGNKNTTGDF
jgi:hypothetical protein